MNDSCARFNALNNVESTFSTIKRKFGDSVRSNGEVAMRNEVLAKLVCHNLCFLIRGWVQRGERFEKAIRGLCS